MYKCINFFLFYMEQTTITLPFLHKELSALSAYINALNSNEPEQRKDILKLTRVFYSIISDHDIGCCTGKMIKCTTFEGEKQVEKYENQIKYVKASESEEYKRIMSIAHNSSGISREQAKSFAELVEDNMSELTIIDDEDGGYSFVIAKDVYNAMLNDLKDVNLHENVMCNCEDYIEQFKVLIKLKNSLISGERMKNEMQNEKEAKESQKFNEELQGLIQESQNDQEQQVLQSNKQQGILIKDQSEGENKEFKKL